MTPLEKKQLRKLRSLVANTQSPEAGLAAKQASAKALRVAQAKFARLKAMNTAIDAGGSDAVGVARAKRRLSDSWTKRSSKNTNGTWKAKNSKPGVVTGGKYAEVL